MLAFTATPEASRLAPTRSSPAVSTSRHTPPDYSPDLGDDPRRGLAQEFHVERTKPTLKWRVTASPTTRPTRYRQAG